MLFELKNLSCGYNKDLIIKNLNMKMEEGDFICVVGPNGAGKTTLIKTILGLIKPLKGEVIYHDLKPSFIGYMPQESKIDSRFPASNMEVVLSGTLNKVKHFYSKEDRERALNNFKLLGISKLKDKSFKDLSGGERQKVLLARSLSATSKLLILDEPSNNLDSKSKKELYKLIEDLNQKGLSIMMITHDLDHGNLIGNKILSLREDDTFFGSVESFVRRIHGE